MKGGVGLYFAGAGVLLALAGCGRGFMSGERAPWRHQAEVACMKSGAVKVGAGVVQIEPIEGPGMCGADFPLKVAVLGESSPAISYSDDLRPPGSIPANSRRCHVGRINEPRYAPPASVGSAPVQSAQTPNMRWVPGPPPAQPSRYATPDQPISLSPPGGEPGVTPNAAPLCPTIFPTTPCCRADARPRHITPQRAYGAPTYQPPQQRAAPSLGPSRAPQMMAAAGPATLTPAATLAVSARVRARPLGQRWRATGGDALVWRASCRDQADLGLFMPRNGRVWRLGNFRTCFRKCD